MKNFLRFSFLFCCCVVFTLNGFSQKKDKTHKVKKGETLYSISKQHSLTVDGLLKANPDAVNGIKSGQVLKIPSEGEVVLESQKATNYISHRVVAGETLYSISKKYSISIQTLLVENPDIIDGLVAGHQLRIPDYRAESKDTVSSYADLISQPTSTVHIGLLLPFYIEDNFRDTSDNAMFSLALHSQPAFDFYKGFLLAADSLQKTGKKIVVTVIDTRIDSSKLKAAFNKLKNEKCDMLIGPQQAADLPLILRLSKEKQIPVIAPIPVSPTLAANAPQLISTSASVKTQCVEMAAFIKKRFGNENIIYVSTGLAKEAELISYFKSQLQSAVPAREIIFPKQPVMDIKTALSPKSKDIIIVCSSDESKVNSLISSLSGLNDSSIIVVGMPTWEVFASLDFPILQKLRVHLFTTARVDPEFPFVKAFRVNYRNAYSSEPSAAAYQGYDIGHYFMSVFYANGNRFPEFLSKSSANAMHTKFQFRSFGENAGYENKSISVYRYEELSQKFYER